ncbi:hypothetical protein ASPWEDRAFT_121698 [Aspergillus wentii DTO 134E9]|uniref:Arabinan endo-1,5-alpha-L-arabinosidase n=1 Tax=Aspergillus wentii DTO 134E9 TaxID=1073089 RepID=A0A1L9R4I8_ASPWE|nr:uncharacterized protein ASPWEDRAFT_121698 [Aspergillus wentii DTO 134E9]KAI9927120.1 hypothetical protein MW887_003503 [Aspergillus wentii]OJJ29845.1 hypothetical protein ASPWEDRAFT_121698 [Aspergillus wentii DTO 134E9]
MVSFTSWFLPLAVSYLASSAIAAPVNENNKHVPSQEDFANAINPTTAFPEPNWAGVSAHDPNIVEHNGFFYMFKGGVHVPIHKATNMNGPWKDIGAVLDKDSVINKANKSRPWAPTTIYYNPTKKFYCFYAISQGGSRNSAIGVASSDSIEGTWTDHGALVQTGQNQPEVVPYTETNAIDPAFIIDHKTGQPHLLYGSYWSTIWSLPLEHDLLSVKNYKNPDASHLAFVPEAKSKPEEGAYMTFHDGYYYLWFSHGKCCNFEKGFPAQGQEYNIRVGRSKNINGPFVDKSGTELLKGGGTIVYQSNHGNTYAPGGLGVIESASTEGDKDVLYFHYLNKTMGYGFTKAQLGWTYLEYDNGWPVAKADDKPAYAKGAKKD